MGGGRGVDLVADFGDGAADAIVFGDVFVGAGEEIFDGVVGVAVGGDEVDGDMIGGGVGEELGDPCGRRGCGATDAKAGADLL